MRVVNPSSKPQARVPLLIGCPRLFSLHIRILHQQSEDAPCCSDRNPHFHKHAHFVKILLTVRKTTWRSLEIDA